MNYNRKVVFGAACLGMLFFGIAIITLGSVTPDLKIKLNLNDLSAGTLFSVLPIGILAGSLAFGPVADRFGYRWLLAVSSFLLFAGFQGIALADTRYLITIFTLLVGFSGGAINGATNAVVADISKDNKGADLSLLGAFFGFGALGMPLLLGLLKGIFRFETVVSAVGFVALAASVFFLTINYPSPKRSEAIRVSDILKLIKDKVLILIAIFLFFQSSFEGIINNWTTSYLTDRIGQEGSLALYGLSSFVGGMTFMRLLTGTVMRNINPSKLLYTCFSIILAGLLLIILVRDQWLLLAGFFVLGAGLSSGFPVMLGFTGNRFPEVSGTAFSLVLSFALIGNTLINYSMGVIAETSGIKNLLTVAVAEYIVLLTAGIIIIRSLNSNKN